MKFITNQVFNAEARLAEIKNALENKKWVKFSYPTEVVKIVKEWNIDEDGDLTADYSSGSTKFVCPTADCLVIEYIDPE